jgi:hypothetical protein
MKKQFIFIDDAGDPGLKESSTSRLVIAAVIIIERENLSELNAAINGFRAGLGWNELDEFKFSSTNKRVIKELLKHLSRFDFKSYAVYIDKAKIPKSAQFSSSETLYNYAIKELLLKLKLYEPNIVIDGVADKKPAQRTRTYLRKALRQNDVTKCKISFVDSRKNSMVQLADIVVGSIARSFDDTKADQNDYIKLLKGKIKNIFEITI